MQMGVTFIARKICPLTLFDVRNIKLELDNEKS